MSEPTSNLDVATVAGFGAEWRTFDQREVPVEELQETFAAYFRLFPWERLPRQAVGFDAGCGSGRWATFVAPRVGVLHCLDASADALSVARRNLAESANCIFHHASIADPPLEPGTMDFGYSLGVLHHVPDTAAALQACVRLLKPRAPLLVYLYYALDGRPAWYRTLWRVSDLARRVISRLPHPVKYAISGAFAATVYWPLARMARLAERRGRRLEHLPLAFYRNRSFFTMRTDAYDRLATRLEQRFSAEQVRTLMEQAGLSEVRVSPDPPFWCAIGWRA